MNQNSMKRLFVHFLPAFQWYHSLHHWWLQILLLSFDHFALGSFPKGNPCSIFFLKKGKMANS